MAGAVVTADTPTDTVVECPECGNSFEVGEILANHFRQEAETQARRITAQAEEEIRADERRRAEANNTLELTDLRRRTEEAEQEAKVAKEAELALRSRERDLEQREKDIELELARGRDVQKAEVEREYHEDREAERRELLAKNQRLQERIEELAHKSRDGSPQDQGTIRQEIFAEVLQREFPIDDVTNIRPGKPGADVLHVIHSPIGETCGSILWEYKSGTRWESKWLTKLATDRSKQNADVGVIVSAVHPPEGPGLHLLGDVWVSDPSNALLVATLLRHLLLTVHRQVMIGGSQEEAGVRIHTFIHSPSAIESLAGFLQVMFDQQHELDAERSSLLGHWENRQKTIDNGFIAVARYVAGLEGAGAILPESLHIPLPRGSVQLIPPGLARRRPKELPPVPTLPGITVKEIKHIVINCRSCGQDFETEPRPGRRPVLCPDCKEARGRPKAS